MRVAAVQFCPDRDPTQPEAALEKSRSRLLTLAHMAAAGTDLVVLPEMAASGYLFPDAQAVRRVAETEKGPTVEAFSALARHHRTWVVGGFPERDGERLFNSAFVLDRAGDLRAVYRKRYLYEADANWASAGDRPYPLLDSGRGRFGVGICMDLNDDGFVGWLHKHQPEAIAFPTNWVAEGQDPWAYWGWRLEGVRGALVAANRWGAEHPEGRAAREHEADTVAFSGASAVLRRRWVLSHQAAHGDGVLHALLA